MSDMPAPESTGVRHIDAAMTADQTRAVLQAALDELKEDSHFVQAPRTGRVVFAAAAGSVGIGCTSFGSDATGLGCTSFGGNADGAGCVSVGGVASGTGAIQATSDIRKEQVDLVFAFTRAVGAAYLDADASRLHL